MVCFRRVLLSVATVACIAADYIIDPETVPLSTRKNWCASELASCPLICKQISPGDTLVNECDFNTLKYGCLCGNDQQPDVSEFSLTLPFFVCREFVRQCGDNCEGNDRCISACQQDHLCGAQNPTSVNQTITVTTASGIVSATATPSDQVFTGLDGQSGPASSGDGKSGAIALEMGRACGLMIVLSSLSFGFLML